MPNEVQKQEQPFESKWDDAIIAAKDELQGVVSKAKRLQNAIRIFQANKRDGVKWPENAGDRENCAE